MKYFTKQSLLPSLILLLLLLCNVTLKLEAQTINDNCEDATLLEIKPIGACNGYDIVYNNLPNTFSGIPNCLDYVYYTLQETPYDLFHKVVVPPSGNFIIRKNKSIHLGIYDACEGNNLQCIYSNSSSEDIEIFDYQPGDTLLLQFIQYNGIFINMCLEELPASPENDLCENATPLCGNLIEGSNELAFTSDDDPMVSCHNKSFDVENTLWYSFTADDSGQSISVYVNEQSCDVSYYGGEVNGFGGLSLGVFSGNCGTLSEEYCTYFFDNNSTTYILNLDDPVAGATYYVYLSSHANANFCSYDITTSTGIETCCGPDVSLNAVCENFGDDSFFVEITLADLANNPSGYIVNDGAYADITSTGTSTIGPFPLGIATVKLTGKDDASCELTFKVDSDCIPNVDNNTCSSPLPITVEDKGACNELTSIKVSDIGSNSGLVPTCYDEILYYSGSFSADRFYNFTVPPSGKFKIKFTGQYTQVTFYNACDSAEIECLLNIREYDVLNYEPGQELIMQLWQTGNFSGDTGPYTVCLEEVDPAPENDNCANAIPLCGTKVSGSTEGTSPSDVAVPNCSGVATENNLWYSFVADTNQPIFVYFSNTCMGGPGLPYESGLIASLLEGDCASGFNRINCIYTADNINSYYEETHILQLQNPIPGNTYYLSIGVPNESICSFEITTSLGIELCCGSDIMFEQNCEGTDGESYFVDIITSDTTSTVGPFTNGLSNIILTAPNQPDCELEFTFEGECIIQAVNVTCENAILYNVLPVGSCAYYAGYNYFPNVETDGAPMDLIPSCLTGNPNSYTNAFYEVVVPTSGSLQFITGQLTGLGVSLTIYDSCGGTELYCNRSPYVEILQDFAPGDTLIFQVWRQNNFTELGFCLQELPAPPENDMCENAIPLCLGNYSGSNINATEEADDFLPSCNQPKNTVWYSYLPKNDGYLEFEIATDFECVNYFLGYGDLLFSFFSGECGGPFNEIFCDKLDPFEAKDYSVNVLANQQYYFQISSIDDLECNFDLILKEGSKPCCAPDISIESTCPPEDEQDVFYIDINVSDLGENPSGYMLNGGEFPNITTTGVTTIGPFENGQKISITLEGLDVTNCIISETTTKVCNCSALNISNAYRDRLIFIGDTLELDKPNFSLLGFECEFMWVTDIENPTESYIGEDETLVLVPDSSTTIYAISTCTNCKQYIVAYNVTVIEFPVCNELNVAASSGNVLFYGNYYNYSFVAELTIEVEDTTECEFLYWVTDIDDPDGSIISEEENHTVEVPAGAAIDFFGIVSCGDEECVDIVSVYTPIFDFYPYPCINCDPGQQNPCPEVSAGEISIDSQYVCNANQPKLTLTDQQLTTGKSSYYVFHNNPDLSSSGFTDATSIYALSFESHNAGLNSLPCASTIYVTAFVSDVVANLDEIDFTDSCIAFSNTVEFTYLCQTNIAISEQCYNNGTYDLFVTITGGLPQVDNTATYTVVGSVYNGGNIYHNQTFSISNLADGTNYDIEVIDDANCGAYVISESIQCDKLPVELLFFNGEAIEEGNLLKWSTATEINNEYFTIESSTNGVDFTKLGIVKGAGNGSETNSYQFLDRQAEIGLTYYRLSQTDFDGTTEIKATTEILRGESSNISLTQVYPVPFSDELNLQLYNPIKSNITISLIDVIGKELINKKFILQQGFNEISLSTASLAKGLYLIAIEGEDGMSYQKVIKD